MPSYVRLALVCAAKDCNYRRFVAPGESWRCPDHQHLPAVVQENRPYNGLKPR